MRKSNRKVHFFIVKYYILITSQKNVQTLFEVRAKIRPLSRTDFRLGPTLKMEAVKT